MKRVIILQARMNSSRLPGKVLMPVLGKPLLAYELERLQRVRNCDALVVATTTDAADDPVAALCQEMAIACYRGSEHDVLDRYYQAAKISQADLVVRVTGDCPLIDPDVVSEAISLFETSATSDTPIDYVSNTLQRSFPRGLDTEVFSFKALESAWKEAVDPAEREHVTGFIYRHPERFRLQGYRQPMNRSQLRWTVDLPEDFELVAMILEALFPENPTFTQEDVVRLLKRHPAWSGINAHVEQIRPFKDIRKQAI
jgi:spore coat polysaccharide biosynthesis protein SpsF